MTAVRRLGRRNVPAAPLVVLVLSLLWPGLLSAAETPLPSPPTRWVTDTAGFMSAAAADSLNTRLRDYETQTRRQLLVWIGSTTGDAPIEDWGNRAFEKWKVGRKGIDDGLVLFIMADDRRLRIEVGYGLEPLVPDILASRIINDVMVPRIRAGDRDGAVIAGMEAVAQTIGSPLAGGSAPQRVPTGRAEREIGLGQIILFGILALIALAVFATNPSLAIWLLVNLLSSSGRRRHGGGSWGGGGGFRGGGGMSGGGGASGSW